VLPPKDTPASLVLETYLHALQAGDCGSAHALAASTFTVSNGDLCGAVQVKNFNLDAMLSQLRTAGAVVEDETSVASYGRFGHAVDPEGNRFEFWEPWDIPEA
jgi:predicted enzyme related to lactoylglutathione lyase